MKYTFNINLYLVDQLNEFKDLKKTTAYAELVNHTLDRNSWQKRCNGKEVIFTAGYDAGFIELDGAIFIIKRKWCTQERKD